MFFLHFQAKCCPSSIQRASSCMLFLSPANFETQPATVTCESFVQTGLHFSLTDIRKLWSNMITFLNFLADLRSTCRIYRRDVQKTGAFSDLTMDRCSDQDQPAKRRDSFPNRSHAPTFLRDLPLVLWCAPHRSPSAETHRRPVHPPIRVLASDALGPAPAISDPCRNFNIVR